MGADSPRFSNGLDFAALGARIRSRRLSQKLTLDELAEQAQVSRSMLSEIERGTKVPTILVFDRIANALGSTIGNLIEDERTARVIVRPRSEQDLPPDPSGWSRRELSPAIPGFAFDFMCTTLPPGIDAGEYPPHPSGSHSFLVVSEGALRLMLDDVPYDLATGDSIYYAADCRHAFTNLAAERCVYYLANYYGPNARQGGR